MFYYYDKTINELRGKAMIYHLIRETEFVSRVKYKHLLEPSLDSEAFIHNAKIMEDYFPHIYGPINISAIVKEFKLPKNRDGAYRIPENLQK